MTTRTKNALGRIAGYAIVAFMVYFVSIIIVLETKSIYRQMEALQGSNQTALAMRLVLHVDATTRLCQNFDRIPYPLNFYIQDEAWDLTHPAE